MITLMRVNVTQDLGIARKNVQQHSRDMNKTVFCTLERKGSLSADTTAAISQRADTSMLVWWESLCWQVASPAQVHTLYWHILSKSHLPKTEPGAYSASVPLLLLQPTVFH